MVIQAIKDNPVQKFTTNPDSVIKTVGVKWDQEGDAFSFKVNLASNPAITKRELLSEIAKIFDPLGLASTVIITAKMLFQALWQTGVDWDGPIPEENNTLWTEFPEQLPTLEEVKIPRWLNSLKTSTLELHGFSDSSEKAYGAVVYLRSTTKNVTSAHIVAAKTRVAPVKVVKLPRLESCAPALLTSLVKHGKEALRLPEIPVICWRDSTITLGWIYSEPSEVATFVANRVAEIQRNIGKRKLAPRQIPAKSS